MKIAFFGTGDFSKSILQGLSLFDIEIDFVVSQPDKPSGRKSESLPTPIKSYALSLGIPVYQPEKLKKNEAFFQFLKEKTLDFIVVVAYGKIMPIEILDIPRFGCINVHGSILPSYRGASPIQEALKNGEKKTGLTIMYMSEGMDEGNIIMQEGIDIDIMDTSGDVFKKFEKIGPSLLYRSLQKIMEGNVTSRKQVDQEATYCKKINKEDGQIDFTSQKAEEIYNIYRAYFLWPGIYALFDGKKFNIEKCYFRNNGELEAGFSSEQLIPGKVLKINKKLIGIVCKDKKFLILEQVKLEGKKSMDILAFLNGNKKLLEYKF